MSEPSEAWKIDCMRWRGVLLTGRFAHWCRDWDGLPVDETCSEFTACECYGPEADEARRACQEREDRAYQEFLIAKGAAHRGPTMEASHMKDIRWQGADEIERLRAELASRYSAGFADAREAAKRLADTFDCYTGHGREYTHEDEHTRIYAQGNKNAANTLSIMIGALKEEQTR